MNYKDIVEVIKEISEAHFFINTWGYGEISDIMTPDNQEPPDYPYMFMNPVSIGGGDRSDSFTFNLICMTQAYDLETDIIQEQSNCLVYLKDVISRVNMTLDHPLIQFVEPYTFTPFKERFQDDVVGFTATMTIQYSNSLDICNAAITNLPPTSAFPNCPQVLVTDGDNTEHYVDAGDSYTCLPATPKVGIFYQRVIPWQGYDTSAIVGSVEWHRQEGTYNFLYPQNPEYIAQRNNGYLGNDIDCLLLQDNRFGNRYRYTNDIGEQYTEGFDEDPNDNSENPRICLDHLTGLMIYVWQAYDRRDFTWDASIRYSNDFTYGGYTNWRTADIGEFLEILDYSDWQNAWNSAYTPWMNPNVRNYGGSYVFGCMDKDGFYLSTRTNGATITRINNPATTYDHNLMVRNFS